MNREHATQTDTVQSWCGLARYEVKGTEIDLPLMIGLKGLQRSERHPEATIATLQAVKGSLFGAVALLEQIKHHTPPITSIIEHLADIEAEILDIEHNDFETLTDIDEMTKTSRANLEV